MTTRFPKNPANGTEVSLGGRNWRFNSTYGVWDKVESSITGVSYEFLANGLTQNGPTLSIDTTVNIALQGFSSSQGASFHGPVYALDGISLGAGGISFNDGTGINTALRKEAYTGQIETVADKTYTIDPDVATDRTITGFYAKTASGTCVAYLRRPGAGGGIKSASVNDTGGSHGGLANTSISAGDVLIIEVSSNSSALDFIFNVEYTTAS